MIMSIAFSGIHHLTLTVSNLERSREFYTGLLGFQVAVELPAINRLILAKDQLLLVIGLPFDPALASPSDNFNENRIGLDHISFGLADRVALDEAAAFLDAQGVTRGEIRDLQPLAGLPITVMSFRDPDNIQLELTAPNCFTQPEHKDRQSGGILSLRTA
jgi:glyoxylase I family protein